MSEPKLARRRWVAVLLVTLGFVAVFRPSATVVASDGPADTEAPVESFEATDLPLEIGDAEGKQREWLEAFKLEPQTFTYTLQLQREDQRVRVYRLEYPSPMTTDWPENNTVPAEFYEPVGATEKGPAAMPAAIFLDIMDGSAIVPRTLARAAARQGLPAIYVPMPYYNERCPAGDAHMQSVRENPLIGVDQFRQAVHDVRRAKAILASRPNVDPDRIGIAGVSMGGILSAMAAGVDGGFYRVVPVLAGGDLADLMMSSTEARRIRGMLQEKGITREQLAEAMAPVDPLNFASRIGADRCLMINATEDEAIPRRCTDALHEAIGKPPIVWISGDHYSAIGYFPLVRHDTIQFLKGGPPPEQAEGVEKTNEAAVDAP